MLWEEVCMLHGIHRIRIYEHICKWGSCESYICGIHEEIADLPNELVCTSWVGLILASIHRCVICFIINKKHWHIHISFYWIDILFSQPIEKSLKYRNVLLYDKQHQRIACQRHCYLVTIANKIVKR